MAVPFKVSRLRYLGGSEIDVAGADIVVIVGPNNSGKTRTLQELMTIVGLPLGVQLASGQLFVLDDVELTMQLDRERTWDWLCERRHTRTDSRDDVYVRTPGAGEITKAQMPSMESGTHRLGNGVSHLAKGLWPGDRLGQVGQAGRPDYLTPPDSPMQVLIADETKFNLLRNAFRHAFGLNLILDAWGQNIRLRVSREETQEDFGVRTATGLAPEDLAKRLTAVPLIETQSDGIKSFAGAVLALLTTAYSVVLVDEPEAFLHPPQARLLGQYLGLSVAQSEGQVFVATHSVDVLLGLLDANISGLVIVRLQREHDITTAYALDAERVRRLWQDPLLRYSRAFDALFHEAAIICEGDTDARFYEEVAMRMNERPVLAGDVQREESVRTPDVLFTQAGDKARMYVVATALRAIRVPVRVIADFDVLNSSDVVTRLLESLGRVFSDDARRLLGLVDAGLRGHEQQLTASTIRSAINAVLEEFEVTDSDIVSRQQLRRLRSLLEPSSGWALAKKVGRAALPHGDATQALDTLLGQFRVAGLFVVPSGTVESFIPQAPGRSTRWLADVIEHNRIEEAPEPSAFVADILASLTDVGIPHSDE